MIKAISFNKEACDFSHVRLHLDDEVVCKLREVYEVFRCSKGEIGKEESR